MNNNATDFDRIEKSARARKAVTKTLVFIFLGIWAFVVLFPFYWMILTSFKGYGEYNSEFIPKLFTLTPTFENYIKAFTAVPLAKYFLNTLIFTVATTAIMLIVIIPAAFAFARLEFKGRDALFAGLLATMMIPGELFTITNYQTTYAFGWNDPYKWGFTILIVPFLVSTFYIYLLRQNFLQIPNELYLAAKVDGVSDIKYLWKVMIPLSLPTLISITILKMMGAWNTYVWPNLVFRRYPDFLLVTNGIRGGDYSIDGAIDMVNYPVQMAAVALVSLPLFMVFLFFRKYIMKGVSRSGIKG